MKTKTCNNNENKDSKNQWKTTTATTTAAITRTTTVTTKTTTTLTNNDTNNTPVATHTWEQKGDAGENHSDADSSQRRRPHALLCQWIEQVIEDRNQSQDEDRVQHLQLLGLEEDGWAETSIHALRLNHPTSALKVEKKRERKREREREREREVSLMREKKINKVSEVINAPMHIYVTLFLFN